MMRRHKIIALLVSLPAAILLWIYVVSTISPETRGTVGGIPVTVDGILVLDERGLIVTEQLTERVSLELRTNRANFAKLSSENIRISADASKITEAGEYALSYTVTFPDTVNPNDIEILRKSVETVRINVAKVVLKPLTVELDWSGAVKEGFLFETEGVVLDPAEIVLTGPDTEVEAVSRAVLRYDISDLEQTTIETLNVLLLDDQGEEVELSELCSVSASQISLTLPIQRTKMLKLSAELIPGGGVKEENAEVVFTPETIQVKGTALVIDALPDVFTVGSIDLSAMQEKTQSYTFPLMLPAGVTCQSGEESVTAVVSINGVRTTTIPVTDIEIVNPPEGCDVELTTKQVNVTIRGSSTEISTITENNIHLIADLQDTTQTGAFTKTVRVIVEDHPDVGVVGTVDVGVLVTEHVED